MNGGQETDTITSSVDFVRSRTSLVPRIGVVLGSGQGTIADRVDAEVELGYGELSGAPLPTAAGHSGTLTLGRWQGRPCVVAQGRCHLYEGRSREEATYIVRLMIALGIRRLILTNAAGGLHPLFRSGELMLIRDHINLMFRGFLFQSTHSHHQATLAACPYDAVWCDRLATTIGATDSPLQQGVYAGVLGPNYETRAEYRMLRRIGADAVGMSTVPEAITACCAGVSVLGISVITNEAKPDAPRRVSHQEVIDWAGKAERRLAEAIEAAIEVTE